MNLGQITSLILGAIGAALGIVNTYVLLNSRRVRLRVTPKSAQLANGAVLTHSDRVLNSPDMAIEVINLSSFPVTVSGVGLKLRNGNRLAWTDPILLDGKPWPRRLDAREAVTAYAPLRSLSSIATRAYVETDCGEERTGTSRAFKGMLRLVL